MRRYGTVPCSIWQDSRVTGHSPECSLVACYLLSNPHSNMIYLYHLPPIYAATETGLSAELVGSSLSHLSEVGFCAYSSKSQFVWVRSGMLAELGTYLKPTDNRVGAIRKILSTLPDVDLVQQFRREFQHPYHLNSEAPWKPLSSPFDDPSMTLGPSPVTAPARVPASLPTEANGRPMAVRGLV